MKGLFCICFFVFYIQKINCQNISTKVYFSDQVASNIYAYHYKIEKAQAEQNYHKVARLYNEFINEKLIDSYLDNFNVDCFDKKKNSLSDFHKPVLLLTFSDWFKTLENEVEVYNKVAEKWHYKIDFLVLIWGDKKQAKKLKKLFHNKTEILYINELRNRDEHAVRMLKHALGVPTIIITNAEKKIKNIIKVTPTFPDLYEYSFEEELFKAIQGLNLN